MEVMLRADQLRTLGREVLAGECTEVVEVEVDVVEDVFEGAVVVVDLAEDEVLEEITAAFTQTSFSQTFDKQSLRLRQGELTGHRVPHRRPHPSI